MIHFNIAEPATEISVLLNLLETDEDGTISITQNGVEVAKLIRTPKNTSKRIGIAKGKITLPANFDEEFDKLDEEIAELFENGGAL